jgi:trk system potassium uptake protein TrkH
MDDKPVEPEVLDGTLTFMIAYSLITIVSVLLVALDNFDFETTLTSVIACFNNIGPGLSMVGPTGNFAAFSPFSKLVLSADMLLGRLEIFPMLLLFAPSVWRGRRQRKNVS